MSFAGLCPGVYDGNVFFYYRYPAGEVFRQMTPFFVSFMNKTFNGLHYGFLHDRPQHKGLFFRHADSLTPPGRRQYLSG
jgi:hypothetical protein